MNESSMTHNEARQILELSDRIDQFDEPPEHFSDAAANQWFARQDKAYDEFDRLIMMHLRDMVIAEARRVIAAEVAP